MIQHSVRRAIVTNNKKPVEVSDNALIIEGKTKSLNSVILSRNSAVCLAPDTNHIF